MVTPILVKDVKLLLKQAYLSRIVQVNAPDGYLFLLLKYVHLCRNHMGSTLNKSVTDASIGWYGVFLSNICEE